MAAMAAQMIGASPHASAVVDEPVHLTAGYLSLVQGDLTVNREHPPLMKALAALPLVAIGPALPAEGAASPPRSSEDFEFDYSRRFLYKANDADRLLRAARLPIVALTLAGALALFVWARALCGGSAASWAALSALALYAFEPNLLAHGRLVTTDMGASVFALAAFAALERSFAHADRPASRRWAVLAGAALGLALLSRFSSLLLVPLMALSAGLDTRRPAGTRWLHLAAALVCAVALVNIGYGFAGGIFPLAHPPIGGMLKAWPLASLEAHPVLRWLPVPLPRLYLEGLDLARYKNLVLEGPGYLDGSYSQDGWWSYFLRALCMKTTLPLLGLALIGLALAARDALRRASAGARTLALYAVLPALGLLALITAVTKAQIGLRYALPVIPLLCLPAGWAAGRLAGARLRGAWAAPALLIAWHAASALAIYPYHLAYFNEMAGGPSRGYRHLVDSNLDWGQDLIGLKRFMQERGMERINLYYFGTADPDYYGIRRIVPAEPGYFAVSATHLMGVYLPDHDYLAAFRSLRPEASIGHSIFIYKLDAVPPTLQRR